MALICLQPGYDDSKPFETIGFENFEILKEKMEQTTLLI